MMMMNPDFPKKQPKILKSLVKVPTQIILMFMFSGSISTKISCSIGTSPGNSNQTRFRFWSGVRAAN